MTAVALGVLVLTSVCLFGFGANLVFLSWRSLRLPPAHAPPALADAPLVCIQIPVYNERYVVERVVDAACAIEWPRDRLEIQVLDDSDDETIAIAARSVAAWQRRGIHITHVRRGSREGYKAGALAHGMTLTEAPFLAILDADFVPPPRFLRGLMGSFAAAEVGFVQARWGHLNEDYSWFTRVQAIGIDFHFLVEHAVRSAAGYFTNFTGTAGVWRRAAIEDAGGWSSATLTEDLDLSFRAQMKGWRAAYREEVVVPEELPVEINAYRRQQARWATGSFQAARKLLPALLAGPQPARVKWQGAVHLLAYSVGPLMLLQFSCYPLLVLAHARHDPLFAWGWIGLALNVISLSPWIGFVVGQRRRGRDWRYAVPGAALQVIGAGMSLTVLGALLRAARPGGEFLRTPKYRIEARGQEWRDAAYVRAGDAAALGEATLAVVAALVAAAAVAER
ncbi:MAG: glycosyltransferase, partial [Chloroflexota bacterium]